MNCWEWPQWLALVCGFVLGYAITYSIIERHQRGRRDQ